MERWVGRVVLVTGASVGIGAAVARTLASCGMVVIGCSRNSEKIETAAKELPEDTKGTLHAIKCDLTKEEDIQAMFQEIKKQHGGVDACINNAGLSVAAPLLSGDTSQWREMTETNILGLSACTREAYQSMKERKVDDGHIINICSGAGHRVKPSAGWHFYSATKFAVRALTEGVRNELREAKSHIRATEISPGIVETEFVVRMQGPVAAKKLYGSLEALQAQDVADAVVYALSAPPHVEVNDVLIRPTEQRA